MPYTNTNYLGPPAGGGAPNNDLVEGCRDALYSYGAPPKGWGNSYPQHESNYIVGAPIYWGKGAPPRGVKGLAV